jgi:uncharacterized protein (TIGR00156 family)
MSKVTIYMIVGFLFLSSLTLRAQIQELNHAGITTVIAAREARDGTWVALTGTILRQVGDEHYLFQDANGTMILEIDHEHWRNATVNPETILRISGEVDREWRTTEVEVERVEVGNVSSQGFNHLPRKIPEKITTLDNLNSPNLSFSLFQLH